MLLAKSQSLVRYKARRQKRAPANKIYKPTTTCSILPFESRLTTQFVAILLSALFLVEILAGFIIREYLSDTDFVVLFLRLQIGITLLAFVCKQLSLKALKIAALLIVASAWFPFYGVCVAKTFYGTGEFPWEVAIWGRYPRGWGGTQKVPQ